MPRPLLTAFALAAMASLAPAQTTMPATRPSDSARLDEMLKPKADQKPALTPVKGDPVVNKATLNPVDPQARPATLKREGGYVTDRLGRVTVSPDGKTVEFHFEADTGALQDPPMVLLPNLALMLLQDQRRLAARDLKFRVTGLVTEYMGRNHLLLQRVMVVND